MNKAVLSCALAVLAAGGLRSKAQLAITEVMSSAATNLGPVVVTQDSDWWELTNFSTNAINLSGYRWNDDQGGLLGADPLPFVGRTIGPGESIIFFQVNSPSSMNDTQFRTLWGLPATVQVIPFNGNGLGASADGVRVWGPEAVVDADIVDSVDILVALRGSSFTYDAVTGRMTRFSTNGVDGAVKAVNSDDVGSPGTTRGPAPLAVTQAPQDLSVNPGDIATFSVSWSGLPRPTYQWQFNDTPIPGARFATLLVTNVQEETLGQYRVVLDNGVESVTSAPAALRLNPRPEPPRFIQAPQNKNVFIGQGASFTARASGTPQPTYQWRHDEIDIPEATSDTFVIANATQSDAGAYSVVATNPSGTDTNSASLLVTRRPLLRVTEVCSSESTNGSFRGHNDWFELSNLDDFTVDLTGYRLDDNSETLAAAFTLTNFARIAPGESVIFVENMTADEFRAWWGQANLPPDLQIFTYAGAALGLSSLGDEIHVWNSAAQLDSDQIASANFATATAGVTYGFEPVSATFGDLSIDGVYGAFRAIENGDIGSPGFIRTPPIPRILSLSTEGDGLYRVRWTSIPGRSYMIQCQTNLAPDGWFTVGIVDSAGAISIVTDPDPARPEQKFYRVLLQPQ